MNEPASLGIALAFSAGLLSFLSPCVLPLVPSYVTFITGLSLEDVQRSRRTALVHALLFILGFTLIFMALGASATHVSISDEREYALAVVIVEGDAGPPGRAPA